MTGFDKAGNSAQSAAVILVRDLTGPTMTTAEAPNTAGLMIPVRWTGADEFGGAGQRSYNVDVREGAGEWSRWLSETTQTQADFGGEDGKQYTFRVQGVDRVGNAGAWLETATAATYAVTKYYYLAGQRVAMRQGSSVSYLYGDHLGSTSLVTDAAGATLAETRYQPYGQPYWQWGATRTDFSFTGQRLDGFGLMDYNARYYSSTLGRFISPDSIIPQPGNPLAWDRYAYVYLNPINLLDPSGHNVCTDDGYCGKLSDTSYQLHMFSEAITEVYDWALKGIWNLGQVKKIYTAGRDIQTYVDGLTNGNGLKWMNKYMGGTIFVHGGLAGNNSFVTGNIIHLTNGWEKGKRSEMHIVHELTHIWDNNSSKAEGRPFEALWVGGGNADLLQTYLGGGIPSGIRWMNGTGGMPLEYQWGAGQYGNNSTADYFAESFMYMIYQPDAIPRSSWEWGADNILKGLIIAETSLIP